MPRRRRNPKRTLYHGTLRQFGAIDIVDGLGIHVGSIRAAKARLIDVQEKGREGYGKVAAERRAVISLVVDLKRTLSTWDCGHWFNPYWALPSVIDGLKSLVHKGALSESDLNNAFGLKPYRLGDYTTYFMNQIDIHDRFKDDGSSQYMIKGMAWIRSGLLNLGYDSISYKNKFEAKGSTSYIIIDKRAILGEKVEPVD